MDRNLTLHPDARTPCRNAPRLGTHFATRHDAPVPSYTSTRNSVPSSSSARSAVSNRFRLSAALASAPRAPSVDLPPSAP
eukprot:365029-Chlamydomonas_euryale.AAC.12